MRSIIYLKKKYFDDIIEKSKKENKNESD